MGFDLPKWPVAETPSMRAGRAERGEGVPQLRPGRRVGIASPTKGSPSEEFISRDTCFAIVPPGIEAITADELRALGIAGVPEPGGVSWPGSVSSVAMANLWLRTASRVVMRVAEFRARTFFELERNARKIPWERFVVSGAQVAFRVTCRKSKLYHSDAVAQRLVEAVAHKVGSVTTAAPTEDDESEGPTAPGRTEIGATGQLFIVRFMRDVCTVSADTSGELLHRRGYRQAVAKAPLRETLAAAMLHGAGWKGDTPLVDPMCGSGTIPIEAAMMARRIPPGLHRSFSFMRWPEHDAARWTQLHARATEEVRPRTQAPIAGADRDAGAIDAARSNAERAGVAADIAFHVRAVSATERTGDSGLLIVNPPYGVRINDSGDVRNLYAQLGTTARERFGGWTLARLSPEKRLEAQLKLEWEERFKTTNGGIPVRLVVAPLPNRE